MKLLDKFIIKKLLITFLVTISLFTLIIIIFDVAEKLDDFMENSAPVLKILGVYYANFVPTIINTFSPIFIFISTLYFTSRLASRSEFISFLAGGMSFRRILRPYMIAGAIIALFSYLLNAWIIPAGDKNRVRFQDQYLTDYWSKARGIIFRQIRPDVILYLEYFNNNDSTGVGVYLQQYEGIDLRSTIFARFIAWNKDKQMWKLDNVTQRIIKDNGDHEIRNFPSMDTALAFNPSRFFFRNEDVQSFNQNELNSFIDNEKERGSPIINFLETEKHRRWASPFSTFILMIIGVSVGGRKSRGGVGWSLAIGIFVIIFFLFFSKYFISMGQTGVMEPWLSAWALNFLFAPVAWIFYKFAQK